MCCLTKNNIFSQPSHLYIEDLELEKKLFAIQQHHIVKIISLYRRRGRYIIGLKFKKLKKTINKTINKAIKNKKHEFVLKLHMWSWSFFLVDMTYLYCYSVRVSRK